MPPIKAEVRQMTAEDAARGAVLTQQIGWSQNQDNWSKLIEWGGAGSLCIADGDQLIATAIAIYYASDLEFTFGEAHRVIKPGGRLFVSGPLPENKQMFYDIIKEATNAAIPPMPGSSRFKGDIFNTIDRIFGKTELHRFENHLTFPAVMPFMEYVRASLSEDRKLWTSMFNGKEEYEALIGKITDVATRWLERDGKLVMTKVVGGILATK